MSDVEPPRTKWHGFHRWVDFLRATASLGGFIILGLWALLTWALDDRYAPASVASQVVANAAAAEEVKGAVTSLDGKVGELTAFLLRDRIFEARVKLCTEESSRFRREYQRQIDELTTQYRETTGENPPPAARCENIR